MPCRFFASCSTFFGRLSSSHFHHFFFCPFYHILILAQTLVKFNVVHVVVSFLCVGHFEIFFCSLFVGIALEVFSIAFFSVHFLGNCLHPVHYYIILLYLNKIKIMTYICYLFRFYFAGLWSNAGLLCMATMRV